MYLQPNAAAVVLAPCALQSRMAELSLTDQSVSNRGTEIGRRISIQSVRNHRLGLFPIGSANQLAYLDILYEMAAPETVLTENNWLQESYLDLRPLQESQRLRQRINQLNDVTKRAALLKRLDAENIDNSQRTQYLELLDNLPKPEPLLQRVLKILPDSLLRVIAIDLTYYEKANEASSNNSATIDRDTMRPA